MARVLNNPFGELRGKTQAGVFTRTRAGQILRRYSKPIDTRNPEQLVNRSRLGSLSILYCNLQNKTQWETFALDASRFNPVEKMNTGNQTGISAFIGLNQIQLAMMGSEPSSNGTFGSVNFSTFNKVSLNVITTPPNQTPSGIFSLNGSGPGPTSVTYEITNLFMDWSDPGAAGTLTLRTNVAVSGSFDGFKDTFNNRVGFLIYISTPVRHPEERPRVILYKTAYFAILTKTTPETLTNANLIELDLDFGSPKHKGNLTDWVQFTVYMVSANGGAKRLISKMIQVTI